jgi:diguanylate cyclase (GGDEF)-like protein
MAFIMMFVITMSVFADTPVDKTDNSKTVKVAYVLSGNFQEGKEGERKSGYGYEYLQKISYYTDWKYEYVYGTFKECMDKLIAGEIDLMGNISYTDERAQLINYSDEEQGDKCFYIFVTEGQTQLSSDDLSTFNGKKIGLSSESFSSNFARKWFAKNNIDCEFVEYEEWDKVENDLNSGAIDAVVLSEVYLNTDWIPIAKIGETPYYYGVSKQRTDLLEQLNYAMERIKTINPFYNENLRAKYITHTSIVAKNLTTDEKNWIDENEQICIGYLNDYMPYCGTNKDTGEPDGVLVDLIDNISKEYSVQFNTVPFDSYEKMTSALSAGTVDAIFPFYGDFSLGEQLDVMISHDVTSSSMIVFNGESTVKEIEKIAISYDDPFQEQYAKIYYPNALRVECATIEECIDAVVEGRADFTVVETAKENEMNYVSRKKKIQKADLRELVNIGFAVKRGNAPLMSILNKGIVATDESLITNSLIVHSQNDVQYTTIDFLKDHIIALILIMLGVFGVIITILAIHYNSTVQSKKKISDAYNQIRSVRWEAAHDTLTGLLNRATFQGLCQKLQESKSPIALLVIDVDNFKSVNDTYGHEMGDSALIKVANVLSSCFRNEDYVIRYAGDEFAVLMIHITIEDKEKIASRIKQINDTLQNSNDKVPKLSISAGVAFSPAGYEEELFSKADQALYHTKTNGRCGYTIYGEYSDK